MHRLRDLDRRGRVIALVVALALVAPFAASVIRAVQVDWTPSNDEALITLRVHDVLEGELPLIGQPSTAETYAATDPPSHPGPIEFYLLAPFVALLGSDLGVLVGAGTFNAASVLVAAWVIFRRAGPVVAIGAPVVLAGVAWSQGLAVLTDPISSNMGGIPLLALAVLAWALVDGDVRLLPLTAFVFAFVCQQHLAVVGVGLGTAAWAGTGVAVALMAHRRSKRGRAVRSVVDPLAEDRAPATTWPWLAAGAAVSLMAWAPVLADQFFGTGNLGRIVRFARASERATLGLGAGVRQGLRSLGIPPLLLRTDLSGDDIHAPLSALALVGCLVVVGGLVAIVVIDRHRRPGRSRLAATALVVAGLGAVNGANVPASVEAARLNFYRWAFVASALAWIAIGWAVGEVVTRVLLARGQPVAGEGSAPGSTPLVTPRFHRLGVGIALVALLVASTATIVASGPRDRRDEGLFGTERHLASVALDALAGSERVLLVPAGRAATYAMAPALAVQLVEANHQIGVPPNQEAGYGDHLVASGTFDAAVVLASGRGDVESGPGRVLARVDLNEGTSSARARLAQQLRGQELVVSPSADDVLRDLLGSSRSDEAVLFALFMRTLADQPDTALMHRLVPRALRAGYLTSPSLDQKLLADLIADPPQLSWGDDVIELRLLTAEEIDSHRSELGL